jgi:chromosomal replication initiation ATPase DnaA
MAGTIWDEALGRIETKVNSYSFHTWFSHTSLVRDDGSTVFVRVLDHAAVECMQKHYTAVIAEALGEVGRARATVVFLPEGTMAAGASDLAESIPDDVLSPRRSVTIARAVTVTSPSRPSSSAHQSIRARGVPRSGGIAVAFV